MTLGRHGAGSRAHVVFLRGANVGGRNVFRPARLAAELAHLDVVNVGAAGTFVVRAAAPPASIEREIRARLPFAPTLTIVPAPEIVALVKSGRPACVAAARPVRAFVAVLAAPPRARPALPVAVPAGAAWSVRVEEVRGRFALGRWRRRPGGFFVPSLVVEAVLGVRATARWWETFERIAAVAEGRAVASAAGRPRTRPMRG